MTLRFEVVRGHVEAFDADTGDFLFAEDTFSAALKEAELWQDEEVASNVS